MGFGLMGKLGRAWVSAYVVHSMVHGWWWLWMMWWGLYKCSFILPAWVRFDLGIGGGLVAGGEEVF